MQILELANILISNFDRIEEEFIPPLLEKLPYTSIGFLEPVFVEAQEFHNTHGKYPAFKYLHASFEAILEKHDGEFDPDILLDFIEKVELEHKRIRAIEALHEGDENKAISLLESATHEYQENLLRLDDIESIYAKIEARPKGLYLGVPEADEVFGSLGYGTMTVIAGPPGQGKTSLGLSSFYYNLMNQKVNLIFVGLESSSEELVCNLISAHAKQMGYTLTAKNIKKGNLTPEEKALLPKILADFNEKRQGEYHCISQSNIKEFTPIELTRLIRGIESKYGKIDGIYLDYLQLTKHYRLPGITDEKAVMNFWCRWFQALGVSMDCATVILAQVNRTGWNALERRSRASLASLAEANELERSSAQVVICRSTPDMRLANEIELFIVKNRFGEVPPDPIPTYADFAHFQIGDAEFSGVNTLDNVLTLTDTLDDDDSIFESMA